MPTIDNGINVTKCLTAIQNLKQDVPELTLLCNVAWNVIDHGKGDQATRCEAALTMLLGAADALVGISNNYEADPKQAAIRIRVCREELKALCR